MHPVIKKSPLFEGMSQEQIQKALALMEAKRFRYKKGEMMLQVSDKVSRFWLVLRGTVHVCMDEADGSHLIMASVSEGETFGEALCFLGKEAPVYAEAKTTAEVLELQGSFLHTPTTDPFLFLLQQRYTAMLAKRALEMNARIQTLCKRNMREKVLHLLYHFGGRPDGKPFAVPFDRSGMAFYLGVDRSALSRELTKMERDGILDFTKNTFIWKKS